MMKFKLFCIYTLTVCGIKPCFSQIEIDTKESYKERSLITFTIKNNDTIDYIYYISLEKEMNHEWKVYKEDIFAPQFESYFLTRIINKQSSEIISLKQYNSDWIDPPNISSARIKKLRKNEKKGKFRLKLYYYRKDQKFLDSRFLDSETFLVE